MATMAFQGVLVSPEELRQELSSSPGSTVILDSSWHLGGARDGMTEFLEKRIKSAQFFDINAIADTSSDLPHMLPSEDLFASRVSEMGISNDK
ncbi:unnamed protein product, partial [Heterosigma akashiwo]